MNPDSLPAAARVRDEDLETAEIHAAISELVAANATATRNKTLLRRGVTAGVAVAASAMVALALQTGTPTPNLQASTNDQPTWLASEFDVIAANNPLPAGRSYEELRTQVLTGETEDGPINDAQDVEEIVLKYSGCRWFEVDWNGTFDELNAEEQAEVQERYRRAWNDVLSKREDRESDSLKISMDEIWAKVCAVQG